MATAKKQALSLQLSTVDLNLQLLEVPKNLYTRGNKWVLQGSNHDFMPKLLAMLRKSTTASAVINRKVSLVAGKGFKVNEAKLPKLKEFLKSVAPDGRHRTGNLLLKRTVKDYERLFGFAVQVVWAADGKHIARLYHQPFESVASGPMNERGDVETYYLCRDWSNRAKYPPREIPAFNPALAVEYPTQLFYYYEDEPGVEYYPALENEAALPYIEMEADLAAFHGTNVASNFSANTVISVRKGPVDDQDENGNEISAASQRETFENNFSKKYSGPKGKRIFFLYGDGTDASADDMAKITVLSTPGSGELYSSYASLAQQAILSSSGCTSPMIAGLPSANGGALGGNGQEMYQGFKLFFNTACKPHQESMLEAYKQLFAYVPGVSFEGEGDDEEWLSITGTLPVEYTFSESTMELIMTDDELRAKIDLKPLPAGAKTAAEPTSGPSF
jgi:hypothetical protein